MKKITFVISSFVAAVMINPMFTSCATNVDKKPALPSINNASASSDSISSDEAQNFISKEKAIDIFIKKYKLLYGTDLTSKDYTISTLLEKGGGIRGPIWNINILINDGKGYITALVDAITGKISAFQTNISDYSSEKIKTPAITRQKAKMIADDFLKKMCPELVHNVKELLTYYNSKTYNNYFIQYSRLYNNIPVADDGLNISVDAVSGKITSYISFWHTHVNVVPSRPINATTKATETFERLINFNLYYKLTDNKISLVYRPYFPEDTYVSSDGETLINSYGNTAAKANYKFKDISASEKNAIYKSADTSETVSLDNVKKYILSFAKKHFSNDYIISKITSNNAVSAYDNKKFPIWSIDLSGSEDNKKTIHILVRQDSGQIYSMEVYDNTAENSLNKNSKTHATTVKWAKAYYRAISILRTLYPQYINDIDTRQIEESDDSSANSLEYDFEFSRVHNGIHFNGDSIDITINKITGDPASMNAHWTKNADFPDPNSAISRDKIKEIYFSMCKPELHYIFLKNNTLNSSKTLSDNISAAEVYDLSFRLNGVTYSNSPVGYINGVSGDVYDPSDINLTKTKYLSPEVINSSPAKRQLQILSDNGYFIGKSFAPDDTITREDALILLIQIRCPIGLYPRTQDTSYTDIPEGDNFRIFLNAAIKNGIIQDKKAEFLPYKPLTKLDMAIWLVNSLNADSLDKACDSLNITFNPKNEPANNYKGYISIFNGLHLNLNPGEFAADDKVTYEYMVYGLYNAMQYMKPINDTLY